MSILLDVVLDTRFDFVKGEVRALMETLLCTPHADQLTNIADMYKLKRLESVIKVCVWECLDSCNALSLMFQPRHLGCCFTHGCGRCGGGGHTEPSLQRW